ncbi:MAG: hypothetical protein OJF47_002506 [Nitrospira sp.]|jgi:bacteriocin biosynthesis cyclodehydratase domain-containing protein|nr:MAG: hypothetical protein OJF47_002506 [Nitrospira sp.]
MHLNHNTILRAFPVQCVETPEGIIIKRGCTQIKVSGHAAAEVTRMVLTSTAEDGATFDELATLFPSTFRPHLEHLIDRLISCRFLIPVNGPLAPEQPQESCLDVFYWHFGKSTGTVAEKLNRLRIVILGVNCISHHFIRSLNASMVHHFTVVDVPALRNQRLFGETGLLATHEWSEQSAVPITYDTWKHSIGSTKFDCLVATSDFGGSEEMRQWNRLCIERNQPFLPVVLKDLVGYIGPLVIPGETACYECLTTRLNSNQDGCSSEGMIPEEQSVLGFHPSMASMLGDLAAFEIMKVFGEALPNRKVGTLIEVKLLVPELKTRKILKIPRCSACSPLHSRASSACTKDPFTPISQLNR